MTEPCKHCGGCDKPERCEHCGNCRNCGKPMIEHAQRITVPPITPGIPIIYPSPIWISPSTADPLPPGPAITC